MANLIRSRFLWGFVTGGLVSPVVLVAIFLIVYNVAANRYDPKFAAPVLPNMAADYEWTILDPLGAKVPFDVFRDKVVFLSNIKPGCPKCIAELPILEALYQKIRDDADMAFVVVAIDGDEDRILDLIADHNLSFPVYRPLGERPDMFKLSLPAAFVIARDGAVVYRSGTGARYDDATFVNFLRSQAFTGSTAPEAEYEVSPSSDGSTTQPAGAHEVE